MKEKPQGVDPLIAGMEDVPGIKKVVEDARKCKDHDELLNIFTRHSDVDLNAIHEVAFRRLNEIIPPVTQETLNVTITE